MASLSREEISRYAHSPVHYAVANKDYVTLHRIISSLPRLATAGDVRTEVDAIMEEHKAEVLSAVIDRKDVPGRESPLQLAIRMGDATAAKLLMASGADWTMQNGQGWSALQEAIWAREEAIAMVIMRQYLPTAWSKWCRRLPRLIAAMQRMRDFYMEITFHFESSVIPFIGRIAPSDTYRVWKRGSNFRADTTLIGFDGFRIQRGDQSFLFLGEGSDDGKLAPGSFCILNHNNKEIINALEGFASQRTDSEIAHEVAAMSHANMYRVRIDVSRAVVVPQLSWRRRERAEMVSGWRANIYNMLHVIVSVTLRRVSGAMSGEDLCGLVQEDPEFDKYFADLLRDEEKKELKNALNIEHAELENSLEYGRSPFEKSNENLCHSSSSGPSGDGITDKEGCIVWDRSRPNNRAKRAPVQGSLCLGENVSDHLEGSGDCKVGIKHSVNAQMAEDTYIHYEDKDGTREAARRQKDAPFNNGTGENEYTKRFRPMLWLAPDFPLKTEELLPLLDILANRVKAVRRLRELLTLKLPPGTFPVKVAIPILPTICVIVNFARFDVLQPKKEFCVRPTSSNKGSIYGENSREQQSDEVVDPFAIPDNYAWIGLDARRQRNKENKLKKKARKAQVSVEFVGG